MRKLILRIEHDSDTSNPTEDGEWEFVSFSRRHSSFQDPEQYQNIGIRNKIKAATAFVLDYFEHGNCVWSLAGNGPQCRWDQSRNAGLLIWTGKPKDLADTPEKRREYASNMLETYTQWCNGETYYYSVETNDSVDVDSCGGFIGGEHLLNTLKSEVFKSGDYVIVKGGCKDMVSSGDLGDDVEIVKSFSEVPADERKVSEIRIVLDGPDGTIYWPRYEGDEDLSETSLELDQALELLQNKTPFIVAFGDDSDKHSHYQSENGYDFMKRI